MKGNTLGRYLFHFQRPTYKLGAFPGWKSTTRVAVLGTVNDNWTPSVWEGLVGLLERQGKDVSALVFQPKAPTLDEGTSAEERLRFFGKKDLDLFSKPKTHVLAPWRSVHFDVVLCMSEEPILPLLFACMGTRAEFRVGCYEDSVAACDLMLIRPQGMAVSEFVEQVFGYLAQINAA
ncbi:hypothetical protein GC167_00505 [bacterium]|nr:hypothetical protein [bacterium]